MPQPASFLFKTMNVIFWIVFIGLCIKTGTLLTTFLLSVFYNPDAAADVYQKLDLSALYNYDTVHYGIVLSVFALLNALQAYIAYLAIKVFKELKLERPFSLVIQGILKKMGKAGLLTGLLAVGGEAYSKKLLKAGIQVPIHWAAAEILFFAGIIYLISQVYQKGMELQQEEKDLTI